MPAHRTLEEIAAEKNWIAFAKKLRAAVKVREHYGFSDIDSILDKVAELRGQDRASLRNPVYAEKWLEKNAPEIHASEPEYVAMTSVLSLIQLERISEAGVLELAPRVFDGTATRTELKLRIENAKHETHQSAGVGYDRWHRKRKYEDFVKRYLRNNIGALTKGMNAELRPRDKSKPVPCDLELWRGGKPLAAVELKSHRQKITHKFQIETLSVASLLLREFPKAFIITPTSWERTIPSLLDLRDRLSLQKVKIAVFDSELADSHPDRALRVR
ncbi:hypothetical protein FGK63_16680 [Ruegeria sediminis]|uniref:Restriction endonuclease n=1 Tax=Ruegeria sediminis TaxID=2583820 RepID=A0ABY2WUH8_9RHOB|nr:hypothetical protein [Ruegeria sediminis]TMV05675.1 hypothetical protein FGK63_16680 [Ruegeria sediminis]